MKLVAIIAITSILIIGWVINIFNVASVAFPMAEYTTINIMRIIGIFIAPLGSVLGLFF